ncbi:MAG TPA: glutaminyl-peptide cyclotransferase [Bryobacteraceae bacterium]|nr:glutaminyl-peptide cyclotransferase [Bryobacteraceae bacterium]
MRDTPCNPRFPVSLKGLRLALLLSLILAAAACGSTSLTAQPADYTYQVVHVYPHDPMAFTQGLVYLDGFLYEGTGIEGQSSVRKVRLETGEVLQRHDIPEDYFGEGIVNWRDELLELTWTTHIGFVYGLSDFHLIHDFHYPGEGWGLTQDGKRIIMSDGSAQLRFWDPETLAETGRITVTDGGQPVDRLNELEWVRGEIYANVWQTNRIARIDPSNGHVTGWVDCAGLLSPAYRTGQEDVLNGIAYDAQNDRLFVTGKKWPKLFEIRLVKR